jgi:hypothetical protein
LFPLPRMSKDNRIVFGSLLPRKARMSILDDAIREHLELKRQHGADEAELKRLEDEAFGPPGRPEEESPFAEAPTEFLATSGAPAENGDEEAGRRVNIADLQEPPPPDQRIREQGEGTPVVPAEDAAQVAPPAEEEPPAMEEPAVEEIAVEEIAIEESVLEEPDEHEAVAEQPTQLFDVEAEMASEEEPPAEVPSPSDEEIADAEAAEPKLAPVEPATEIYASRAEVEEDEDEFDEFFSDQRLSEELDQALEAPLTEEHETPAPPAAESPAPLTDEQDEDEYEDGGDDDSEPEPGPEDVLEDTPDFLEDAPEDDELWFEQRPPKDFDFDD